MKQIVSQDYSIIIFPNNGKEFNIRLEQYRCSSTGIETAIVHSQSEKYGEEKPVPSHFIIFDGFQGNFCLGEYSDDAKAKRAMRVISDYLSDMHWELTDQNGNPYFDGDVLIMPDEDGNSQLFKNFDNLEERDDA